MKRATILAFLFLGFAVAADPFQKGDAKVTASVLNVRNIASSGGEVVGSVRRGDIVRVIDRSVNTAVVENVTDYWYKIALPDGKTGWVFGGFITFEVNMEAGLRFRSIRPADESFNGIAFFPSGEAIAGTDSGNLFATADRGRNFRKIVPQALGNKMGTVHRIIQIGGEIWIAAGGSSRGGIWKTSNSGASWTQFTVSQGLPSNEVNDIFHAADGSFWAATDGGIAFSRNAGVKWEKFGPEKIPGRFLSVIFLARNGTGLVLGGAENGLYAVEQRSGFFGGKTEEWSAIGSGHAAVNCITAGADGSIFYATDGGLFRASADHPEDRNAIGGETVVHYITIQTTSSNQTRIIVATDNGLNISLDQGVSWSTYKTEHGLAGNRILQAAVHPQDKTIWTVSGRDGISLHD